MKNIQTFESFINESIDVDYWAEFNDDPYPGIPKEFKDKSKNFEKTFEDAFYKWEVMDEYPLNASEVRNIKNMAEQFFKKAGWISIHVIHSMITKTY